jgi:ribonuclease P protein component
MALAQGRFRPEQRIRKRSEYRRILNGGVRVATPHCVFVVASREAKPEDLRPRLGLVVSRKVGGAVLRNRFKRLAREVFRKTESLLPRDADIVVIARGWSPVLRESNLAEEWAEADGRIRSALVRFRKKAHAVRSSDTPGAKC